MLALVERFGPRRTGLAAFFIILTITALGLPAAPFSIDNMLYIEMARAMAENSSFSIALPAGVVPPEWLSISLTYGMNGGVYPQYPGGYALIAAPFYALMGVHGLALMNVIAACAIVFLTHRIALRQYGDRTTADIAAVLLAVASFLSVYAVGVWPHLVTLALIMAGVERAVCAAETSGRRALVQLSLAGLAFGLAINLRVDAIFPAAAVVIWLRLFAFPSNRLAALALIAGMVPGVVIASVINYIKFQEFSPFSYGPTEGTDSVSGYAAMIPALAVAGIVLMAMDWSAPWVGQMVKALRSRKGAIAIGAACLGALLIVPAVRQFAFNVYVLVFDLQQLEAVNWQAGVARGEDGFIAFWGAYKKAFLQSLPWAGLMVAPIWAFIMGRRAKAHALALGVIAAPIAFYSLNQWHGGYSFSMRYFLPALPFVAILSAVGLRHAIGEERSRWRVFIAAGAVVLVPGLLLIAPGMSDPDHNMAELHYYPAMLALAGLAGLSMVSIWRPDNKTVRSARLAAAGGAVAIAVLVNVFDVLSFAHRKDFVATLNHHVAGAIADGPLVLSVFDESLAQARAEGAGVMNPRTQPAQRLSDAIRAYRLSGRCVYVYLDDTFDSMQEVSRADWRLSPIPGVRGELGALYQPVGQEGGCDPSAGGAGPG